MRMFSRICVVNEWRFAHARRELEMKVQGKVCSRRVSVGWPVAIDLDLAVAAGHKRQRSSNAGVNPATR